ncbi:MAG: PEP-CTERM sorting domain-containing protein, partial [Luteolibacter sp.]
GTGGNWGFSPNQTNSGFAPLRIDAGGGNYNYGWVEVTVVSGNTFSPPYLGTVDVTVTGFAFNSNVNEAIEAGAIPEPSTVACLLLGGSAFAFSRRRRLEQKQSAS